MACRSQDGDLAKSAIYLVLCGAQEENRTPDLRITSALLYRLSYPGDGQQC